MERIEELPLTHVHAFTYSPREGTPSASMGPGVRGDMAKARHRELTERIRQKNLAFRREHHRDLTVLLESGEDGRYRGYDQYYNRIVVRSDQDLEATWVYIAEAEVHKEENRATLSLG